MLPSSLQGAGCGAFHQLRSVWRQRQFYLLAARTGKEAWSLFLLWLVSASESAWSTMSASQESSQVSEPGRNVPLRSGRCFREWDLRHKHPGEEGTEERSRTQSRDLGVWLAGSPVLHHCCGCQYLQRVLSWPWAGRCKPDLSGHCGLP